MHRLPVIALVVIAFANQTQAQESSSATTLPQAPSATRPYVEQPWRGHLWDDFYTASLACSSGVTHAGQTTKPVTACGGALGFTFMWFEVGAFTPQVVQTGPTGYWTVDGVLPLDPWHRPPNDLSKSPRRVLPLATLGYTRIFQTANAVDFSAGADVALNYGTSLRFELKDYVSFNSGLQHNAVFRVTFVHWIVDP